MEIDIRKRKIGVNFNEGGTAEVLVWAPLANSIELKIIEGEKTVSLNKKSFGFWETFTGELKPGGLYQVCIDGEKCYPDPASLSQPEGVHGPSQAINPDNFIWSDSEWKNIPVDEYIIYEQHVGTFTPEGTYDGVRKRLPYLRDLGITAIELMPADLRPTSR